MSPTKTIEKVLSAVWSTKPKGKDEFLPVILVSFALNSWSDCQLARTAISPVNQIMESRQQAILQEKSAECSLPVILVNPAPKTNNALQSPKPAMLPA